MGSGGVRGTQGGQGTVLVSVQLGPFGNFSIPSTLLCLPGPRGAPQRPQQLPACPGHRRCARRGHPACLSAWKEGCQAPRSAPCWRAPTGHRAGWPGPQGGSGHVPVTFPACTDRGVTTSRVAHVNPASSPALPGAGSQHRVGALPLPPRQPLAVLGGVGPPKTTPAAPLGLPQVPSPNPGPAVGFGFPNLQEAQRQARARGGLPASPPSRSARSLHPVPPRRLPSPVPDTFPRELLGPGAAIPARSSPAGPARAGGSPAAGTPRCAPMEPVLWRHRSPGAGGPKSGWILGRPGLVEPQWSCRPSLPLQRAQSA